MEWVVDSSLTLTVRFKGQHVWRVSSRSTHSDLACSGQRHMHWEGWLALQEITFCHIVKWHMALWLKRRLDPGGMGVTANHKILYATPTVLAVAVWHHLTVFSPNIKWMDLTKTTTTTKKTWLYVRIATMAERSHLWSCFQENIIKFSRQLDCSKSAPSAIIHSQYFCLLFQSSLILFHSLSL